MSGTQKRRWIRRVACSVALWCLLLRPLQASEEPFRLSKESLHVIRHLAIQHNGRVKPFESFARETLALITGQERWQGEDPALTVLSVLAHPDAWQAQAVVAVPFRPLREQLGMPPKASHISSNDLIATRKLMRMLPAIVEKQQRDEKLSMLEAETMDVYQRFVSLSSLFEGDLTVVPAPAPATMRTPWLPIFEARGYDAHTQEALQSAWTTFLTSVREASGDRMTPSADALARLLRETNPAVYPSTWRLQLEVLYHHAAPFHLARLLYAAAFLALAWWLGASARPAWRIGFSALGAGFVIHAAGIVTRVILGGRPPVSNFYETMLWLPFVAVLLALIFERVYRVGFFGLSAAVLAGMTLWLADYVPLDSSVAPVVAVLRSNLWLTIHVLTIVASYGALALATVLAHVYAWMFLMRRRANKRLVSLDLFLYRTIQVGVVLLAAGTMLGAVWANASWGRYWGWDPKETWALITLLWFIALLHGRFAGWLKGVGVALATIAGFFLLLMTYYGVSFYLVGLHSYAGGHAKPLPPLLIAYLLVELLFLGLVGSAAWRRSLPASASDTRTS